MKKTRTTPYVVNYDKSILISYLALALLGLLTMLNITSVQGSMGYFYKQLIFLAASILVMVFIVLYPNLEKLKRLSILLVLAAIVMLVAVLVMGINVKGATRLLKLGPISFQPSFLARLALVVYYAYYLEKKKEEIKEQNIKLLIPTLLPLIVVTGLVYLLILIENHMSTLVISGGTLMCILFYAGLRKRFIAGVLIIGLIGGVSILTFGESFRMKRIEIYKKYNLFIRKDNVQTTPADEYQVKESLAALSSGGLFGTGIAKGRAKHYYLPEARTDYVFTIIGEELGFLGAIVLFALQCLLFFRSFKLAESQESYFLKFLCAGVAMNIFFNALVNVGVSISILPPTGNTLPFVSYGGSALMMDSIGVGIILNISATRRYV